MSTTATRADDLLRQIRRLPPRQRPSQWPSQWPSQNETDPDAVDAAHPLRLAAQQQRRSPANSTLEEECPFGVFGRLKDTQQVLKPERISAMGAWLAMNSSKYLVFNDAVKAAVTEHPEWFESYTVVEAFDSSLMLPGHVQLMMRMVEDPSTIPDSPPAEILEGLAKAIQLHPEGKIWFAEPLFTSVLSDNASAPTPMTAEAFRAEALSRLGKANSLASQFGWRYRLWIRAQRWVKSLLAVPRIVSLTIKIARERAEEVERARLQQQDAPTMMEYWRTGRCPGDLFSADLVAFSEDRMQSLADKLSRPEFAVFSATVMLYVQLACIDPLLFLELPNEPGKLRLIGHWYWADVDGKRQLQLHV